MDQCGGRLFELQQQKGQQDTRAGQYEIAQDSSGTKMAAKSRTRRALGPYAIRMAALLEFSQGLVVALSA